LPWLLGKYGSSRAICSSVSQYGSLIASLLVKPESNRASHINGS
jgi:type III secretory pathway component EscU